MKSQRIELFFKLYVYIYIYIYIYIYLSFFFLVVRFSRKGIKCFLRNSIKTLFTTWISCSFVGKCRTNILSKRKLYYYYVIYVNGLHIKSINYWDQNIFNNIISIICRTIIETDKHFRKISLILTSKWTIMGDNVIKNKLLKQIHEIISLVPTHGIIFIIK